MRIAYATTFNACDVHHWSGTPYYMSQAFVQAGMDVQYIGNLKRHLPRFYKFKQFWKKQLLRQHDSLRYNIHAAKQYSQQVAEQLPHDITAVIAPLINPIAFLECKAPIILWTDALYAGLLGFYSPNSAPTALSVKQANVVTAECLKRCRLAIFSSEWAANTALQIYGADRNKVKVVPFGANIDCYPDEVEIEKIIQSRSKDKIKLLFLAKEWERKGGDIVVAVAKRLYETGYAVELAIVGYTPPLNPVPPYIKLLGFISKDTEDGKRKLRTLLAESHLLFVPSRAEAYGIVFCEANAYAVPCLTTYVGGIGTIIKDHVNGMTFPVDATIETYCSYIVKLMSHRSEYEKLAYSAYQEFKTRLNWQVNVEKVKALIREIV